MGIKAVVVVVVGDNPSVIAGETQCGCSSLGRGGKALGCLAPHHLPPFSSLGPKGDRCLGFG